MYSPILNPGRSHFGSNYWEVFSSKLNRDVNLYSNLEYDHWVLVETNPYIINFCEQPLKIELEVEGKKHSTIFDMWVKWKDGKEEFIEIKYHSDLQHGNKRFEKTLKQLNLQKRWCEKENILYRVITEKEIRGNTIILENKKIILPYLRNNLKIAETTLHTVHKEIKQGTSKLDDLYLKISNLSRQHIKQSFYILIIKEMVHSNFSEIPLGPKTEVWV
jgi:hypothetical protein